MIRIIDILMALLPVILITIALLLACALRIVRRGTASSSSPSAVADDPFFFPFGEMPTVPRERDWLIQVPGDRVEFVYGRSTRARNVRIHDASDFRAWGIPQLEHRAFRRLPSAGEVVQVRTGVRPPNNDLDFPGTGAVLTFPKRGA